MKINILKLYLRESVVTAVFRSNKENLLLYKTLNNVKVSTDENNPGCVTITNGFTASISIVLETPFGSVTP